jgi:hypothetical protein
MILGNMFSLEILSRGISTRFGPDQKSSLFSPLDGCSAESFRQI